MSETYTPDLPDLSTVEIPEELTPLVEQIAEHVHDVWALGRIMEGWAYGEARDDEAKKHPCLLPYCDLPDSEKEYDRNTAMSTVQLLLSLGWTLTPPAGK